MVSIEEKCKLIDAMCDFSAHLDKIIQDKSIEKKYRIEVVNMRNRLTTISIELEDL